MVLTVQHAVVICLVALIGGCTAASSGVFPHGEGSHVRQIKVQQDFRTVVLDTNVPVLVAFYDTQDTRVTPAVATAVERTAEQFAGIVMVAAVDGTTSEGKVLLGAFGSPSMPSILLFNPEVKPIDNQPGQMTKHPIGYSGDASAVSLGRWLLAQLSTEHLELVSDDHTMADFFGKFVSMDMPRFLFVTNADPPISPALLAATHEHRYGAAFAVASFAGAPELVRRYRVDRTPALLALVPVPGSRALQGSGNPEDEVYAMDNCTAASTAEDLSAFISRFALPRDAQDAIRTRIYDEENLLRRRTDEHSRLVPAVPPLIIRGNRDWVRECLTRKKGVCLAVFVDGIADEAALPLEMLHNASRKIAAGVRQPYVVAVVDGLHNHAIAAHFGMTNGLPDAIFLNPAKRTYVNLVGSVTERGLSSFVLEKALRAPGKPYKAKDVPKFVKTPTESAEDNGEISDEM